MRRGTPVGVPLSISVLEFAQSAPSSQATAPLDCLFWLYYNTTKLSTTEKGDRHGGEIDHDAAV